MSTFLQPVSPVMGAMESVSSVTLTNSVPIGTLWGDASGNQYVYCYNAGNSVINQGQYAVLATGVSGYSVSVTGTTFLAVAVGVCRNASMATATYGWLMYKGFTGISTDSVSFTTGQALMLGANGNFQAATAAAGSFVTAPLVGIALTTINTATTASTAAALNAAWVKF